jgi:hypothetical protein
VRSFLSVELIGARARDRNQWVGRVSFWRQHSGSLLDAGYGDVQVLSECREVGVVSVNERRVVLIADEDLVGLLAIGAARQPEPA